MPASPHDVEEFFGLCGTSEARLANESVSMAIVHAVTAGNPKAADCFRTAQDALLDGLALMEERVSK